MTSIVFNSKSAVPYNKLSNFYGDVEINYMKTRFNNPEVKALFDDFKSCSNEKFIEYLKILQPGKVWTSKKEEYWFKNGEPIRGILAKLVGSCVKNTPSLKRRQKIIMELTGVEKLEIEPPLNEEDRKELMYTCLKKKFASKEYRDILLSTGTKTLHEKPMRGKGDNWTFPGNDWLGILLTKLREEI